MAYLFSHFWFWLLGAFIVGIATALLTRHAERPGKVAPWLMWCGLAFAAGLLLALLHVLVGRPGLWLETGLAAFATFIAGAYFGAMGRKGDLAEHKGWALGIVPAALLWIVGNVMATPDIEKDLKQSVGVAIKDSGGNPDNFKVEGRDVLLPNGLADRSLLAQTVDKVDGVRLVSGTDKTFAEAPMAQRVTEALEADKAGAEKVIDAGKKALTTGWADPTKAAKDAADKALGKGAAVVGAISGAEKAAEAGAKSMIGAKSTPDAKAPEAGKSGVVQTGVAMSAADAKGALKALPAAGALDAAQCQTALNATLALDKIQFISGGVSIRRAAAQVLDRLAALLQRCPDQKVEIGGHTDNVGAEEDNQALSQRRADKVMQYLVREGVAAARLSAVGYGAKKPIASNDTDEGQAQNRRIEFVLK